VFTALPAAPGAAHGPHGHRTPSGCRARCTTGRATGGHGSTATARSEGDRTRSPAHTRTGSRSTGPTSRGTTGAAGTDPAGNTAGAVPGEASPQAAHCGRSTTGRAETPRRDDGPESRRVGHVATSTSRTESGGGVEVRRAIAGRGAV